ncbi:MAG: prepilin-type N-terminal cleavage/methylation domain-containing protein [Gallionella sp.]|nr:prepilin-type N-terminal cleavage/methylation domain-containing protein [Gallionella sp.]
MKYKAGFTLIELIVVMVIVALLASIVAPKYIRNSERAKETVLKENLFVMRDALQKYYGDKNEYPAELTDLVTKKYLRKIPIDPMTENDKTWKVISPEAGIKGNVYDVRSGATGNAADGTPYSEW